MSSEIIPQEILKEIFEYNPTTGDFVYIKDPTGGPKRIGSIAGTTVCSISGKHYRKIKIKGRSYFTHRLAWLYMTGNYPALDIDHIDGNGMNNSFSNLREVTPLENARNMRVMENNTSGFTGVHWHKAANKWMSTIRIKKELIHLGYFSILEDAINARKDANIKYGFHPQHGTNRPL